jgi:uncharacterized protein involved in exopolysaccharide biosynthesis
VSPEQQLLEARAYLSSLELKYTADHPDVVRIKRLIADLEPRVAAIAKNAPAGAAPDPILTAAAVDPERAESLRQMRAEMESLDRQMAFKESEETRVRADIAEYQRRVEAVPGIESEWVSLTRDYDTQQAAYRELLNKSAAAQLAANLEEQDIGERFRIVDPAVVPVQPLPSQRLQYNGGGFAVGLLLALLIAVALEIRDKSFRSESDVLDVVGLPVLATVPGIITTADRVRLKRRRIGYSVAGLACFGVAGYLMWTMKLWNSLL